MAAPYKRGGPAGSALPMYANKCTCIWPAKLIRVWVQTLVFATGTIVLTWSHLTKILGHLEVHARFCHVSKTVGDHHRILLIGSTPCSHPSR